MSGTYINGSFLEGVVLDSTSTQNPATVGAAAYVAIGGSGYGIALYGLSQSTAWTVANLGTVKGTGTRSTGLALALGGVVTNGETNATKALIAGSDNGVDIKRATGNVSNFGTIEAGTGFGVLLGSGGGVDNAAAASIGGATGVGIYTHAGSVANSGTIAGSNGGAVVMPAGGTVTNSGLLQGAGAGISTVSIGSTGAGAGAVENAGSILANGTGSTGVWLQAGGAVSNSAGDTIESQGEGVSFDGGLGSLANSGTIAGALYGAVYMQAGGYVGNTRGGLVQGFSGIAGGETSGVTLHVVNAGVVEGTGSLGIGVFLPGGTVGNSAGGTIAGYKAGVSDYAGFASTAATIVNAGTIEASATHLSSSGVVLGAGGYVGNDSGGLILGVAYGVDVSDFAGVVATIVNSGVVEASGSTGIGISLPAGTVTNAGTISGGDEAIAFAAGAGNRLIVDPGGVFYGAVSGGGGTMELAAGSGVGTLYDLGRFTGFASIVVDPGASWTISGTAVASGTIDLGAGATLTFTASAAAGEHIDFGGGGSLLLDDPSHFAVRISGFAAGDTIDLVATAADAFTYKHRELTLTEDGHKVAELHFLGRYRPKDFQLSSDGNGGTTITFASSADQAPFWTMPS
jgi:hypothetical protein